MGMWWPFLNLSLLTVLALSACGVQPISAENVEHVYNSAQPKTGYTTYLDEENRFHVARPEAWFVVQEADTTDEVFFIDPSLGGEPHDAVASVFVQGPARRLTGVANTADRYIQRQTGVTDFEVLAERTVQVDELPGLERTISYRLNGHPLTQHMIYLRHKEYTFVLSLTTPDENVARYTPIFDEIIQSFTAF